jgi:heptosyltransferase III
VTPRILFIAPTRIGDAVLSSVLLEYIRTTNPDARITLVASPFSAPLFEGHPQIESLYVVDKQRHGRHWLRIMRYAWQKRWSAVWDLRGSALAYVCLTRRRYVFSGTKSPLAKCEQYRLKLGLPPLTYPKLWPTAEDEVLAEKLISPHNCVPQANIIAFAPCANWLEKEWPIEHFITLAVQMFDGKYRGFRPLVICSAHERIRALPLLDALKAYQPIDATAGEYSLLTIYACLARCAGFIGNDSGLMHMSAASGIPTIGLFGPTDAVTYQPTGAKASYLVAPNANLHDLTPQMVREHAQQHIPVTSD